MAKSRRSDRFFKALPFIYMVTGLGTMLALRNGLAVISGLILIAVGGIELLRRTRFRRELERSESRLQLAPAFAHGLAHEPQPRAAIRRSR
jgi:hypothetical protein